MKTYALARVVFALMFLIGVAAAQERRPLSYQEQGRYMVSANAGIVNLLEGDVTCNGSGSEARSLATGDQLRNGDQVETGANGRLELLLTPGTYLRLGVRARLVMVEEAVETLRLKLLSGSAIVEASTPDDWKGTLVTIETPTGKWAIAHRGLYRFDVAADGHTVALVRKGKLIVDAKEVKEGKRVDLGSGSPAIASFDEKAQDDFDLWSKDRSESLLAANRDLSEATVSTAYDSFYSSGYTSPGFDPWYGTSWFGSTWFYNPSWRCYTFVPGWRGIGSPYGSSYGFYYPPSHWRRPLPTGGIGFVGGSPGRPVHPGSPVGTPRSTPGAPGKHTPDPHGHRSTLSTSTSHAHHSGGGHHR